MTINKSEYQIAGINKLRSKEKRKISLIQNKSLDKIINKNTQKENMISPNQELLPGITAHLQRDHYKHELVLTGRKCLSKCYEEDDYLSEFLFLLNSPNLQLFYN